MFKLQDSFVEKYASQTPDFGFNGLGLLTYYRTYSRIKPDGKNEHWHETVRRVVEGCYSIQKQHIESEQLGWNEAKAQKSAQEMYDRIFKMKFLPPGRMLWAMGTDIVHKRGIGQALFNCAFVSTKDIGNSDIDATKPFEFMMDMSMVGVGVGFDVKGAGKIKIKKPYSQNPYKYVITDDREGWVTSLKLLLQSYFVGAQKVIFDYSHIRVAGEPIKGFGGVASGYEPLKRMHEQMRTFLDDAVDSDISETLITDIMNLIGQCVVAGNIRRTAQISIGSPESEEFLKLKDYQYNPETQQMEGSMVHRAAYGWASNNSVYCDNNTDFAKLAAQSAVNGEPGYVFLDNIQKFSRMCDPADFKDIKAVGTNPCAEQSLESYELCNVIETFPSRAESKEDFLRTLKFAYLLGKTATLVATTWEESNQVQKRNRRIGTSVSGVTDFLDKHNLETLRDWLDSGYKKIRSWDEVYSAWLCVPKSIKVTSVKPSGTVSLLAGVNSGVHFPEFKTYIRRVRISKNSPLLEFVNNAGLQIEADVVDSSSMVVSFPIKLKGRSLDEVSIWEQVSLAVFLQEYWSDNQVSCTVTFTKDEASQIKPILEFFKYRLKSISFLPKLEGGAYPQMPYEAISEKQYKEMASKVKPINVADFSKDGIGEKYCNTDKCEIQ